ncbi:MAG: hypothetical protein KGJ11_09575, partial [Candidatus Omnitrophica bacterium]|nr:hypothetical protein [Candidatus Omnitrophota bacterium]
MALLVILTFLSAFLLFQIELIIAKLFLPNYGGSFLVWGACIVFFQAVLLAGYIFAHTFLQRLGAWRYLRLHLWLLLAPLLFFPLRDVHLSFARPALPLVFDIFARLTVTIGPVFFTLSTMSLVTQSWLAASFLKGRLNPYRLYAVSNLGSFMALLTYPFFFELFLTDTQQLQIWRILYLVLAFVSILAFRVVKIDHSRLQQKTAVEAQPVALDKILRWLGLGAAGVVMFLSVTNMVTYEVAPVPLLWVLPLGIYLMAFVLNFKQNPWCPSWLIRWIGPIIGLQTMLYFLAQRHWLPVVLMIILLSLLLWCTCMYIQHQLVLAKPTAERMTFFYVMISLGGFLGGMLTTWIIPVISDTLTEYLVGLFLLAFLLPPRQKPVFWPSALWFSTATLAFFVWPYFV